MSPRPLHRSMTFWSGMLVMGFICWAWWDSMRFESAAYRGGPGVSNIAAFVGIGSVTDTISGGASELELQRKPVERFDGRMTTPAFPLPLFLTGEGERDEPDSLSGVPVPESFTYADFLKDAIPACELGDWILFIPHWLLLLAVALPWWGLMVWRGRRMRRGDERQSAK